MDSRVTCCGNLAAAQMKVQYSVMHLVSKIKKKSKSFIRYGSNACWIHTVTIKYKYKLDNKNIKI